MGLVDELGAALSPERIKTHPLERHLYGRDAGIARGRVAVVVFPETTAETVEVIRIARSNGMPVVPRGAGTGLAGGAVPTEPGVVVALTRMNRIFEVDVDNRTAWVGPGVINLDLSRHTDQYGLHFAPDPSSQSACTIGGNVACNSGGPHCLAEGTTVDHV
ncbi:MAG: FAD-binding oxidoreductase, partial [Acidimicrobiia bacterium]